MRLLYRLLEEIQRKKEERDSLDRIIEELIDIADPSIRRARGYKRILRKAVQEASSYCSEMIGLVPGPVRLSRQSYFSEPVIRAIFTKAEEVEELLKNSPDVEALRISGFQGDAIGLLTMDKEEKTTFGHEKHGDLIQRDVAQRTVNFTAHRIVAPSPDLSQTKAGVIHRGLEVLATVAMEKITSQRAEIAELRRKRDYLSGFMKILNGKSTLQSRFAPPDPHIQMEVEKARISKAEVEAELQKRLDDLSYPRDSLRYLETIIQHPSSTLTMGQTQLHLNWMNVLVDGESGKESDTITLMEMTLDDELHRYGTYVILSVE